MATKKSTKTRQPAKKLAAPRRKSAARKPASRATAAAALHVSRRAIFIDVENTSSEETLSEVLEGLKIDRAVQPTEITAVGNWRAVGQRLARHLASLGAQLVHSAPALGVRDWSDLWIAVAAGCWLGQAKPGDVLEIVSNDRAFDAVGDAAAARGVVYHRLLHRRGTTTVQAAEPKPPSRRSRGGRRHRRGRAEHPHPAAAAAPAERPRPSRPSIDLASLEPHGASRDQMLAVIGRLTNGDPGRWVNLDVLEKALKSEGFARPPGSPRLVTRLRMLKEVEVDSHGRVRLVPGAAVEPETAPTADTAEAPAGAAPPKRRRRRSKAAAKAASLPAAQ